LYNIAFNKFVSGKSGGHKVVHLTIPLLARRECFAPFSNKSHANPSSMKALGAMLDAGERVTIHPTMTYTWDEKCAICNEGELTAAENTTLNVHCQHEIIDRYRKSRTMRPHSPPSSTQIRKPVEVVQARLDYARGTPIRCQKRRGIRTSKRVCWMIEHRLGEEAAMDVK
jgi:hypothetical protein